MRNLALAVIALSPVCFAQEAGKTLRFAHTSQEINMQEIATVVRAIVEIRDVSMDTAGRTLSLKGSPQQMQAAEWVFQELDRPLAAAPPAAPRLFRMEDAKGEGLVRVFHVANAGTPHELQELATAVRAITEIRRLFTYNAPRAIAVRGTEEQIAAAEWLLQQIDRPSVAAGTSVTRERAMTDPHGEGHIRIFFLAHAATPQSHQELATCVRAVTETRRVFTNGRHRAILTRGTTGQMEAMGWLIGELDRAPGAADAASREFRMQEDAMEGVVRVFYAKTASAERLQTLAMDVRRQTSIRRVFTHNATRAIAVRGTAQQITQAGEVMKGSAAIP